MKKILFVLTIILVLINNGFAKDNYGIQNLITTIQNPQKPVVKGDYIIFTSPSHYRTVGIAFDFEDFEIIHPFEKLVSYDTDNEPISSVLFHILEVPKKMTSVSYKLIINGLWTLDPLNTVTSFNPETNIRLSTVLLNPAVEEETEKTVNGGVRFVYEGETGEKIRLAGSFTNWDSFIYELNETSPGFYELTLPLPKGTHYYAYYKGLESFVDKKNPERVYTSDGRPASVITLD